MSVVAMVGVLVAATLTGWPPVPVGRSFAVAPGEGGSLEATIGILTVPVSSETEPDWPGGDMHHGLTAPAPAFSVEGFGRNLPLSAGTPTQRAPWHPDVPDVTDTLGVYLGDLPDGTGSIFAIPGRDCCGLDGLLAALFDPTPTVCIWIGGGPGNGYVCYDETQVGTDTIHVTSPNQAQALVAVWLDVPTATSVVSLSIDEEPVGWQQPTSRIAAFTLPAIGDVRMAAYDSDGNLLDERTVGTPIAIGPRQEPATTTITSEEPRN
jgi:hypothetical protein